MLRERLKNILSRASDNTVEELLESVIKPATVPSDSLAARLLNEKCTPNEIHLALLFCRNALLMDQMQSPEGQNFKTISKLLARHDRITSFLLQAMQQLQEQAWDSFQTDLLKEGHAHLLERSTSYWSQKRRITLYNYYSEMQVSVSIKLLQAGEDGCTTEVNRDLAALLSASSDGKSAYARLPESELSLQLSVEEVTRNTLHWRYGEFLPLTREKRRDARVQISTPVHINLKSSDQGEWNGSVMDISALGLGISYKSDMPFQVGDMLAFSLTLQGHHVSGKGAVCWVHGSEGHYRAGLAIEHNQESHLRFSNEVHRRQKNLMGELKLKGVPDCMIA